MNVLVIRQILTNGKDVRFVMAAKIEDSLSMISPVMTLEGQTHCANGNPYLVYGDACAKFTGRDKLDLNITVAECVSGDLSGWSMVKKYMLVDRVSLKERERLGMEDGSIITAKRTGEFRRPRAGEWYLSGSTPMGYNAPNDLSSPYYILRLCIEKRST